ncbi:hypothetical protein C0J52_28143 [Blattella germanica]|nr:hypothetical protein C0J52_28143 [Blattella germanica]
MEVVGHGGQVWAVGRCYSWESRGFFRASFSTGDSDFSKEETPSTILRSCDVIPRLAPARHGLWRMGFVVYRDHGLRCT